jgi:hypothetical protein
MLERDDGGDISSDPEWYGIDEPHDADVGSENECMLTAPF